MAADPMLLDGILEQLGAGAELDDTITATSSTLQAMLEASVTNISPSAPTMSAKL